jgi:hypothetical protein
MIEEFTVSVTTTGSAGSASGNATGSERMNGLLVAVYLPTGAPPTTDWVFSSAATSTTLFTFTNINTAGWYSPLIPGVTAAAGVAISGAGVLFPVLGPMKVAMAQSDAGTYNVIFRVLWTE